MMNWNNEGRLRVGASMTIGCSRIPDYVRRFSARMPGIDVRVQIQSSRILVEDILARELDLAIIETPIHNRNLAVKKLFEDNLDVICPARPPYFADRRITLGELSGFPLLLREHGSGARDILKNVLSQRGLRVEPIWESGVTQALLGAVESGMGVSIIPHIIAEPAIREGRVFRMELTDACLRQNFYLIRLAEKTTTPAMETFMAGVMESCAESGS
jgi:DNA-binding transcriptional LysR family regulator